MRSPNQLKLCCRTLHALFGHLSFLQLSIDLPEVFSEELFSNGLSIDSNPLPYLDQMWGTVETQMLTLLFSFIQM